MLQMTGRRKRPIAPRATISWTVLPNAAASPGRLQERLSYHVPGSRALRCRTPAKNSSMAHRRHGILRAVLDVGFRTVAAGGGFGVPLAVRRFVFDHLAASGHALLGRRQIGRA